MRKTIKFYVTVRFALLEKLALKTPNDLTFSIAFALFFRTIDGLLRYGALKNSDKFALPTVYATLNPPLEVEMRSKKLNGHHIIRQN
jgi:hypothetical protein